MPKEDSVAALGLTAEELAVHLLEHFLLHFTVIRRQSLTVIDAVADASVAVGDLYQEVIGPRHKQESFEIRSMSFTLHHLYVKPTQTRSNVIKLYANDRPVETESVSQVVSEVARSGPVTVQGHYRYHGYVTGAFLDEIADDDARA